MDDAAAGASLTGPELIFGLDGVTPKTWSATQVANYISGIIINSAPGTLDTLDEIAAALADDPNFAATMTAALAGKQPLDADLTAIAALVTDAFGRALLTKTSAREICAYLQTWYKLDASAVAASHTGDLVETTVKTVTVPAGAIGPNGRIRITHSWSWPNNGNTKTPRIRFGGIGGSVVFGINATTTTGVRTQTAIANVNAQNAQKFFSTADPEGFGTSSVVVPTSAIDTSAATDIVFTALLGNAGDTLSLEDYCVELLYGA